MFQSNARINDGAGKGSAVYRGISALGTGMGIGVAILATPTVFGWTRAPLFNHLLASWGEDWATLLTWAFGGVEGFVIYAGTKLAFTLLTIWTTAALAARRFPSA